MNNVRKFAAALVLGLVMCMALFTTGALAHTAYYGHGGVVVSANSSAVATTGDDFWDGFGLGGFGFGFGPFLGGACAHANVHIFGNNFWY